MENEPRGRPRAEPRTEQRARIIDAARQAFTQSGYDDVTVSSIAEDALVSRATVYEVVGGKEQVLEAVANVVADELIAAVNKRLADPGPLDRPLGDIVRDHFHWTMRLFASEPSYAPIIAMTRRLDSAASAPFFRGQRRLEESIAELHIAIGAAAGVERNAAAHVLSVAVLAMLEGVTLRAAEEEWPTEAIAELIGDFAAGGYLRTEGNGASQRFEDLAAE